MSFFKTFLGQTKKRPPVVSIKPRVTSAGGGQAREIIVEAKDQAVKIREAAEAEARALRQQLLDREVVLDKKSEVIEEKLRQIESLRQGVEAQKIQLVTKLEKLASLTREEAKNLLLKQLDDQLVEEMARRIKEAEEKARAEAEEKAREILVEAMRHGATSYVAEYTVSTVKIPDEDTKGRIIGKEGRNIRAFERATGVDLDLDEIPGEVRLSGFDPIRREVAKMALRVLIADGRIQPTRIEEEVAKARREISRITFEEGKKLAQAVGVYNLPAELMEILGKFKFRFSYGQNMIAHTLEETKMGIALAREMKANVDTVRLGCLLHDIGKVVTDEEGSHVELGVKLLQRFKLPQAVIDCVAQHHEDEELTSPEAVVVYMADAISGARPGARYEDYEEYAKRLSKLEETAKSFTGVAEAYAIQAGREVRVIVNPEELSDAAAVKLAHDLKLKIEKELTYPGTVRVTVVREVRATDVAK